jgi:thiamine-phosphate pyrophosphorylase
VLDLWLEAGVRLCQLRAKRLPSGAFLELADAARARTARAGARLIINDRVDIAMMCGADGVHLGQADLSPAEARRLVGDAMLIGFSTHTLVQLADGLAQPVSYLAIGPVFETTSKAGAVDAAVGVEGVRQAADRAKVPLVAIGGITLDRVPEILAAGAASVAIIADVLAGDPASRIREYLQVAG